MQGQIIFYSPGIGTIGSADNWTRLKQNTKSVFELATGYGLDSEILVHIDLYVRQFEPDDNIFLFGFSRGALYRPRPRWLYTYGRLASSDQLNVASYALTAYKRSSEANDFSIAWNFSRVVGGRSATIKFIGVWDTVASVLVPRADRVIPSLLTLPYTRTNRSVEVFRHAMAIDERRRMFRLNRWVDPQPFVANPFDFAAPKVDQDIKQVWFAGSHSDIGGGYPGSRRVACQSTRWHG